MMSTHPHLRLDALPQTNIAEESTLHVRRRKLSALSRPFPPGFIPVQHPSSNRRENRQGGNGPVFLPADLRSPLLPPLGKSFKEKIPVISQESSTPLPSTLSPTNNQPRFIPSIKRLCSNVLGHRPAVRSDSNMHPSPPKASDPNAQSRPHKAVRSQTDQSIRYNGPGANQARLRSTSTVSPKASNLLGISKNAKDAVPVAIFPPQNPDELPKKPSISSKVIKKAKSIGELRPQRKRSISLGSTHLNCSCRSDYPGPKLLTMDQQSHEVLLNSMSPQVSSSKWGSSRNLATGKPASKDKSKPLKVPTVSLYQLNRSQSSTNLQTCDARKPIDLPYYIELESIEVLESAHDLSSLENFLVSF